jgi:hypothetical protein
MGWLSLLTTIGLCIATLLLLHRSGFPRIIVTIVEVAVVLLTPGLWYAMVGHQHVRKK